jgi:hypothetical protein
VLSFGPSSSLPLAQYILCLRVSRKGWGWVLGTRALTNGVSSWRVTVTSVPHGVSALTLGVCGARAQFQDRKSGVTDASVYAMDNENLWSGGQSRGPSYIAMTSGQHVDVQLDL